MPITLDGTNGITTPMYNGSITANAVTPSVNMKNRIINGAMVIDQRNAGAAVTTASSFPVDRFICQFNTDGAFSSSRSTTAPTGFTNSLFWTTTTADASLSSLQQAVIQQNIEGFNIADLGWGTANAKTVTLSFWVRSSLTGTFGGSLKNSATNRSYPFTYTISVADTWEFETITIAGDTSGTWLTDNGTGITVSFGLGVGTDRSGTAGAWNSNNNNSATGAVSVIGTLNATFYITGVQLEVGSTATSFDYRPYGTELALCQRYYYRIKATAGNKIFSSGAQCYATTGTICVVQFPVTMRTEPSALEQSGTAGDYRVYNATGSAVNLSSVLTFSSATTITSEIIGTVSSGLVAGNATTLLSTNSNAYLGWSAEL
jgi:hypothetical protein